MPLVVLKCKRETTTETEQTMKMPSRTHAASYISPAD